jgi:hypothetical protein
MKKKPPPGKTVTKIPKTKIDKNFINGNLPSFPKRKVHSIKIPEKTIMHIDAILYDVIITYCFYPCHKSQHNRKGKAAVGGSESFPIPSL